MNFSGYPETKKVNSRGAAPDAHSNNIFGDQNQQYVTSTTKQTQNQEALANKYSNQHESNIFGGNDAPAQQVQHKPHFQQKRQGYNPITGELYNDEPVLSISEKSSSRGNAPTYTKTW